MTGTGEVRAGSGQRQRALSSFQKLMMKVGMMMLACSGLLLPVPVPGLASCTARRTCLSAGGGRRWGAWLDVRKRPRGWWPCSIVKSGDITWIHDSI
jgi:hypothetical protein